MSEIVGNFSAKRDGKPQTPPELSTRIDRSSGIIFVISSGFLTFAMIEQHFREMRSLLSHARGLDRGARIFADLSQSVVQEMAVSSLIDEHSSEIYNQSDRVALVVPSSLVKIQMRRSIGGAIVRVFTSKIDAREWLDTDM